MLEKIQDGLYRKGGADFRIGVKATAMMSSLRRNYSIQIWEKKRRRVKKLRRNARNIWTSDVRRPVWKSSQIPA